MGDNRTTKNDRFKRDYMIFSDNTCTPCRDSTRCRVCGSEAIARICHGCHKELDRRLEENEDYHFRKEIFHEIWDSVRVVIDIEVEDEEIVDKMIAQLNCIHRAEFEISLIEDNIAHDMLKEGYE